MIYCNEEIKQIICKIQYYNYQFGNEHPSEKNKISCNALLRNLIIFMSYRLYWDFGLLLVAEKCSLNNFGLPNF